MSHTESEVVGRVPPRSTRISSSVSLEETRLDAVSKEIHQQIEVKKLQIENKMID